jgi:3D (Asp-Asp-Asp) domain-containing protein
MKTLLILLVIFCSNKVDVASVTATIYHADPRQCNADYLTTASLKKINPEAPEKHRWIAVSRDLEPLGFTMGTKVCIEGAGDLNGEWTIEDRMNKRWTMRIDFLVSKKRKGGKWNNVKMYIINEKTKKRRPILKSFR